MKKLLTLFAATLMALVPAAAGNQPEAAQMETKTFQPWVLPTCPATCAGNWNAATTR